MLALAQAGEEAENTHDQCQEEGDRSELCEQLSTICCVCFSNRSKDLGLGKVTSTSEEDVPRIGEICDLQKVKNAKEHATACNKYTKHEQPRLVSESCGYKGNSNRKDRDEQEGL